MAHFHARNIFILASRRGLSLADFSVLFIHNVNKSNNYYSRPSHHMYADDTQIYIELSQSDTHKSISSLSDSLTDISLWMKSSKLKLHSDKTEFIIIGTK